MQTLTLKLIGEAPLLLHSDRGSNPLHPDTIAHKVLTDKKKKTYEDHVEIAKSSYMLAFYGQDEIGIPTANVKGSITDGAKLHKLGKQFGRSILIFEDFCPVSHSGPSTKEAMWNDPSCVDCRSVKVGQSRVMRYRPRLNDWSLTIEMLIDENMIDKPQIIAAAENAGRYAGLGDHRPGKSGGPFGRFRVEVIQ